MFVLSYAVAYATAAVEWFVKRDVYTTVSFAVVIPLLLLTPFMFYRLGTVTREWLNYTNRLTFFVVVLNALGTGYFHSTAPQYQYDRLLHFGCAAIAVILVILLALVLRGRPKKPSRVLAIACVLVIAGIFVWEGFQYFSDHVFRSRSFYDARQAINRDFWEDVGFGLLGIAVAVPYARRKMPTLLSFVRTGN